MQGLILNGSKNVFEVECDDGITRSCPIKGKILKASAGYYNPLAPGDIVEIDDETLEERVGYYGERLVLEIQKMGLNTCWAGTFSRKNIDADVADDEKLVISIAVGYGKDQGRPHKSKTAEQVIEAKGDKPEWFNKGVEMALLAPTAINQQKFKIRLNEDGTVDIVDKGGPFSKVDKGIVRRHFEIGAEK